MSEVKNLELVVTRTTSKHAAAIMLIGEMEAELVGRYGDYQISPFRLADVDKPGNALYLATCDGVLAGCGALKPIEADTVEIKRMYVRSAFRRMGVASRLLSELEKAARKFSYHRIVLETANRQPEAVALYERAGYSRIPSFGEYVNEPRSICFEKILP
ncbi:GNAT family N-acetyltransferase [Leeia sp. TBRC 13508]|uniref:GNAT family N-acetyltransferase n=1 Tax=Leeia speluncae TaxID=2884804 RepID=A0ABS8D996_9NEIS|nr:GNAT family N-acetyltransferase [Leeia speluncae]MCB6184786.1 GNAT family N-acetyltransferase [Leeia speluncae]